MKEHDVPQFETKAMNGEGKALYAVDADGNYTVVRSAGWEAEEIVLSQAIGECERLAADAHARAKRGDASPLEYHMYKQRMDVLVLAQSTGYFQWRVRRHLKAGAFAKLSTDIRTRYAEVLGMSAEQLDVLPPVA
ncbi:MAG: hypothetical protein H7Z40_16645 [Phycisphaerae bacterium]|nr:hypothetical protein [Gemmatimonadaceae bacterium]